MGSIGGDSAEVGARADPNSAVGVDVGSGDDGDGGGDEGGGDDGGGDSGEAGGGDGGGECAGGLAGLARRDAPGHVGGGGLGRSYGTAGGAVGADSDADAARSPGDGLRLCASVAQYELLWRIWKENISKPGRKVAGALGVWGLLTRNRKVKHIAVDIAPLVAHVRMGSEADAA